MSNGKADPKIIDLIKQKQADNKPFASIEYFPPRTEVGVKVRILLIFNFFVNEFASMNELIPNFIFSI
jgi:hypothetical protein